MTYHVIPLHDMREHELLEECWCNPTRDEQDDIMIHHSMDGRESFETGERLPS